MIDNQICDFVGVDWHTPIEHARKALNKNLGIQGNMDPRIFYQDYKEIEKYLNSLTNLAAKIKIGF